jgi:glycerol-3-phosphate dehydrogenase subunit B
VPGERLSRALAAGLRARGVSVVDGVASAAVVSERRAQRVMVDGARVKLELLPKSLVLAGGRFLGGGIVREQRASEPLLGLPVVVGGAAVADRFVGDLLDTRPTGDHALFRAGVAVDERMRPVDLNGAVAFDNVTCAGSIVEGWDPARDGAAGAVAALTGFLAGEHAAQTARGG